MLSDIFKLAYKNALTSFFFYGLRLSVFKRRTSRSSGLSSSERKGVHTSLQDTTTAIGGNTHREIIKSFTTTVIWNIGLWSNHCNSTSSSHECGYTSWGLLSPLPTRCYRIQSRTCTASRVPTHPTHVFTLKTADSYAFRTQLGR